MDDSLRMPEVCRKHKVFSQLDYMMEFYDLLSMNCICFIPSGTQCLNYVTYVYLAIQGTLDSISILLRNGRINDAYSLIRKLFDDILLDIYLDVTLKDKFGLDNNIVGEVDEWLRGKHRIPKTEKIIKVLEKSEWTKDLYPLFGWNTYLKKNRELLDDSMHSNRFQLMILNCNTVYIEDRERHFKNCEIMLDQLFLLHLSFIFHLNPHYLSASDYRDALDMKAAPQEGSENWIAPFAQEAFDKIIKPHKAIADFILESCCLEIDRSL